MATKTKRKKSSVKRSSWTAKFNTRARLIAFVVIIAVAGTIGLAWSRADTGTPENNNATFFYQRVDKNFDTRRWGDASLVVASNQGSEANEKIAVEKIKSSGAKAYRYVQGFWFPQGRVNQNIDLAANLDWRFCDQNGPVSGKVVNGVTWWVYDLNEKEARNAITRFLRQVKSWGYDGVFIDMGNAAIKGRADIKLNVNQASTCTSDPVVKGRSFADSYIGMATQAKGVGLEAMLNYSKPNQNPKLPSGWYNYLTSTFDEETQQSSNWNEVLLTNLSAQSEKNVVMMVKSTLPDANQRRRDVFLRWARAKLFEVPVTINTGDDQCPGASTDATGEAACLRYGVYPELVNVALGKAFKENGQDVPGKSHCQAGSDANCLWIRHYEGGTVLVNTSNKAVTLKVNTRLGSCRYVKNVWNGHKLAGNTCTYSFDIDVPAQSGRVAQYSVKP